MNVGCIPKKLFHQAALLGDGAKDAKGYGWANLDTGEFRFSCVLLIFVWDWFQIIVTCCLILCQWISH